jgi:hypothetical protein
MFTFKGVIAEAVSVAEKIKAGVIEAASKVDSEIIVIQKDAPIAEAAVNAFIPGAGNFVSLGVTALESLASVIDAGGAAAKQNLVNAGLDSQLAAEIENLIPSLKKLKK